MAVSPLDDKHKENLFDNSNKTLYGTQIFTNPTINKQQLILL